MRFSFPFCLVLPSYAHLCPLYPEYIFLGKIGEKGKSGHISAANGSQMVVKIRGSYYRQMSPWHTNKILIMGQQGLLRRRFAAICALAETCISAGKPGEPGKSRQIAAMDGSQMVVEIQRFYYRARFSGHRRSETAFESLP